MADHPKRVDDILNNANSLVNSGEINRSIAYLDSAFAVFPNPGPGDLWDKYSHLNNFYLNYDFNTAKAKNYVDSMFLALQGKENIYKIQYAKSIFARGDVLRAEKRYNEAFKNYYDGRAYAKKNLDSCNIADFTNRLGLIKYAQHDFLQSIPFFKQAFREISTCKPGVSFYDHVIFPQSILNNIALCFERSDKPDSAVIYYTKALDYINKYATSFPDQKPSIDIARGVIYGNMGGVYAKLNKQPLAEKYLKQSIAINDRAGYAVEDAQTAKVKLACLYINASRLIDADNLIKQLFINLTSREGNNRANDLIKKSWYKLKWDYYEKTNDIKNAHKYLQRFVAIEDSLTNINNGLKRADIDRTFLEREQQYQLNLLSRDSKLKTLYLFAIIIFTIMSIVILSAVWYNLKRSKKYISELTLLNLQVNTKNDEMKTALTALEQSQADNTRMMHMVAHDLRNPIGGMTMLATLMLKEKTRSVQDLEMLQLIKTSGQNSLEMVSDLLQVHTRSEEMKKEPVDILGMLHYCVDILHHKAAAKGQKIILEGEPVSISVNREKMWRVVSNLLANAIKFSVTGATIIIKLQINVDVVLITVEDRGIGIPKEMKDKVFDMFTDTKRQGTAGEQPFGMGLAISKQIVEAHGGKIWYESIKDNGTTFFVQLPRHSATLVTKS